MLNPTRFLASAVGGDPVRRAVQTATAAVGAYALMSLAGLPQTSWAVVSALFVTQMNVGATIGSVLDRLSSAAIGTLIGLGCLYLIGTDGWMTALSLAVAAFVIDTLSGLRPGVRFANVVAGILIVSHQSGDPLATALWRALAIGIGALVSGLVAILVLPVPAHRRAEHHLAESLRQCGRLMERLGRGGTDEGERRRAIQAAIRDNLQSAMTNTRQSRRHADDLPQNALAPSVQTLWHTLDIVHRIDIGTLPAASRGNVADALGRIGREGHAYLGRLADSVESGAPPPSPDGLGADIRTLSARILSLNGGSGADGAEARAVALGMALREVGGNLRELSAPAVRAAGDR